MLSLAQLSPSLFMAFSRFSKIMKLDNIRLRSKVLSYCVRYPIMISETQFLFDKNFYSRMSGNEFSNIFPTAPTMSAVGKEPHFSFFSFSFSFLPGDLYWIGSDKSCSTLIGRHKLGVVQMQVDQPLTKLWCVHLLNPATERCHTQIF